MKAILITTNDQILTVEVQKPLYKSIGQLVDGFIEIVRPINLQRPYVMICNEDYCALEMPFNILGSYMYGTQVHGHPVLGNIVIMKEWGDDLEGLHEWEIKCLKEDFETRLKNLK